MSEWLCPWEDYAAGLYTPGTDTDHVTDSAALLADPEVFRETAREMIREWPLAAVHNLQHMWTGRNAWVGQAACCYAHNATSQSTRAAWGTLTNQQQQEANNAATAARSEWERNRNAQTLFGY